MPPRQQVVQCDSLRTLECELDSIRDKLSLTESEETWDTIAKAVIRFTTLVQNGASNFPNDVANGLRSVARPLNSAILSERSRLSGAAINLLKVTAEGIGKAFDGLIPLYIPTLLTLCSRSNKVFISRAKTCVINIIEATQTPTILSYLAEAVRDKSLSLRLSAAEAALACLNSFNPPDLEREARAREIEALIRATATDPSADVRKIGRQVFEAYKILLPHRVDTFTAPLTPTMRKYLDIKSRAPSASGSNPPSRASSSQSTHSAKAALTKPSFVISKSSTTLFPTAGGSRSAEGLLRARTISNNTSTGLTRSESAPSTSKSTSAVSTAAPSRPAVGPARPRPTPLVAKTGPSRPVNSRDMPPPATIPIRPQPATARPATSSSEPNPFAPSESNPSPLKTSGGPLRPTRVAQDVGDVQKRVVGGARRVLLPEPVPPPPPAPPNPEVKKTVTDTHTRTASGSSADQVPPSKPSNSDTSKKTSTANSSPAPTVDNKKADPPLKAVSKPRKNVSAPGTRPPITSIRRGQDPSVSTSTTTTTRHTAAASTSTTATRRGGTTGSRLTEPTQSQLARAKATQKPAVTKKTEVAKPIGSRVAPSKTDPPPKGGVTARKRVVSAAPRLPPPRVPSPEIAAAAVVPLPPSPLPVVHGVVFASIQKADPILPSVPQSSSSPRNPKSHEAPIPANKEEEEEDDQPTITQSETVEKLPEIWEPHPSFSPPLAVIHVDPATPDPSTPRPNGPAFHLVPETPISSLLESIQRGFEFSPAPAFDPDQTYGGLISVEEVRCEPLVLGQEDRRSLHPIL